MDLVAQGRFDKLQSAFNLAVQCLLTVCSRKDVNEAFSSFTDAEKERLHRMLIQVMKSLHGNIVDDFKDFCQETQVAAALDKIDDFVEEQSLDALSAEKTTVEEIQEKVSRAKKDEIEHLNSLLKKVEASNSAKRDRIELLKKGEDLIAAREVLNKVKQLNCTLLNLFHGDSLALSAPEQSNTRLCLTFESV